MSLAAMVLELAVGERRVGSFIVFASLCAEERFLVLGLIEMGSGAVYQSRSPGLLAFLAVDRPAISVGLIQCLILINPSRASIDVA